MDNIKQDHIHMLVVRCKDGKWIKTCLYHECDYEEPIKDWEFYEADM